MIETRITIFDVSIHDYGSTPVVHAWRDLLGIVVQPLDLHLVNMESISTRRLLTRSGDDGHAKAGAKTGGDLVLVRTQ